MALNRSRPYAGCIKRDSVGKYQVHLGLYHYFMFWTAYCDETGGRRGTSSTSSSSYATRSSYGTPGGFGGSSLGGGGAFLGGQWPSTPLMNRPSLRKCTHRVVTVASQVFPSSRSRGKELGEQDGRERDARGDFSEHFDGILDARGQPTVAVGDVEQEDLRSDEFRRWLESSTTPCERTV